jgi:hypothetical protein
VSFVDRTYPDLVRDVLTTLTAGVAGEVHQVVAGPDGAIAEIVLNRRPVARVSQVTAVIAGPGGVPVSAVLGLGDVDLAPLDRQDAEDASVLRFPATARRRPLPGTDVVVNYYPRTVDSSPIDDVAVGSVARTIVEAIGREMGGFLAKRDDPYISAVMAGEGAAGVIAEIIEVHVVVSGHPGHLPPVGREGGPPAVWERQQLAGLHHAVSIQVLPAHRVLGGRGAGVEARPPQARDAPGDRDAPDRDHGGAHDGAGLWAQISVGDVHRPSSEPGAATLLRNIG